MAEFSLREVVQLAGLSRGIVMRLVRQGVVAPQRARGREYRFSFQDLIVLRTARGLYGANVPPRRITTSLGRLRERLPASLPLSGLRVSALGSEVVVHESTGTWDVSTGQLLLDFDVTAAAATAAITDRPQPAPSEAQGHFDAACRLEDDAPEEACARYRQAIASDPGHVSAYTNLGCLLHALQRLDEAAQVYATALEACSDKAVLWYNLGVLREDMGQLSEALQAYAAAIALDPGLADAHYTAARLYAAMGRAQDALRCFNQYRRLSRGAGE